MKAECTAPKKIFGAKAETTTANVIVDDQSDTLILSLDSTERWVVDTGASFHACPTRSNFKNFIAGDLGKVYLGNDLACDITGKGDVDIRLPNGSIWTLVDVRYVPCLRRNLISVSQLAKHQTFFTFGDKTWKATKGSMVVARGILDGTLYVVNKESDSISIAGKNDDAELWHNRLGHMSEKGMKSLISKGKLAGLKSADLDFCEDCVLGKQRRVSFSKTGRELKTQKLELVHTDVWGPTPVNSLGGSSYFVTFIDDSTRKVWVYFLKHKSDVFTVFKKWLAMVENETGLRLKCLRSDNGGEYCASEFKEFCAKAGIKREFTVPRTPQQNGVAERMNRTITERARCMRLHSGLPPQFWADAVNTAAYLINRGPSVPLNEGLPEEAWSGKAVNHSHLKVFGCSAYVHIDAGCRSKLDPKSKKCTFVGYGSDEFGYKFWDYQDHKFIRSRDVIFNEKEMYKNRNHSLEEASMTPEDSPKIVEYDGSSEDVEEPQEPVGAEEIEELVVPPHTPTVEVRKSGRVGRPTQRYSPSLYYLLLTDAGEPECFSEAAKAVDSIKWESAMKEEMNSLKQNQTWDLTKLPKGKKALHNKWVYRLKEEQNGTKRYKARLVVKGFQQKEGIDYTEIFSPVVKMTTIRVVLSMVAVDNLHLEQMDVKTAFLHGDLEEELYMLQPEGFAEPGKEDMVCRLKKSLYGLKQAPRQWYRKFDKFMSNNGYSRCEADHCCYLKHFDDSYIILLLYVDDMLIAGSGMDEIKHLKGLLSTEFDMKDLGPAKQILGMRIDRDRSARTLKLSQSKYIERVLERFNMKDAKAVSTPLASHFRLSKDLAPKSEEERMLMEGVPYASAVGSLMYAMVSTRPDIAHAVGVVSRFMSNPGKQHWEAVKWILRYLKGTSDLSLCFGGREISLHGYVDSDMAGDIDGRRSTTGYVFTLGSAAVSWISRLQKTVALSTTEAEYVAITEASKEMIWLQSFMKELGKGQENGKLHSDSMSVIHLAKNAAFHSRTKHIQLRYHFIRSLLEDGALTLEKIHTSENPADMFTKCVNLEKLKLCSASVGLLG